MTMLDTGNYGAKVQSWSRANPCAILEAIVEENPGASEQTIGDILWARLRDDEDALRVVVIRYWLRNNYRRLFESSPQQKLQTAKAQRAQVESLKTVIKARAERMVLLDMTMPNGKPLRDCNGKYCAKAGGWLSKIAAKIKPTDIVGKVLSETQVRKLFVS